MVIWKGYGFLVLVIAIAIGAIVSLIFGSIGSTQDMGAAVGAIISAVAIWFLGTKLNSADKNKIMIDKATGNEVILRPDHSLFFIKMQYWAFIVGGIGIVMLCNILIHGKSTF